MNVSPNIDERIPCIHSPVKKFQVPSFEAEELGSSTRCLFFYLANSDLLEVSGETYESFVASNMRSFAKLSGIETPLLVVESRCRAF